MRGEFTYKILQGLGDAGEDLLDFTIAVINAGYGASSKKIDYEFDKIKDARSITTFKNEEVKREKQKALNFLYKLKRDGLIEAKRGNIRKFKLTFRGLAKLKFLYKRNVSVIPSPVKYGEQKNGSPIIVVFDIPEKERAKRNWLRAVLKNFGFKMIQKSVWFGKKKIPHELVEDIKNQKLVDCIEILEISKSGTLRQII